MSGDEFLSLLLPWHQAVLVEDHLHAFFPELPGVSGHLLIDPLAQFARPGRVVEPGKLLLKLYTEDLAATLVPGRSRGGGRIALSHALSVPHLHCLQACAVPVRP